MYKLRTILFSIIICLLCACEQKLSPRLSTSQSPEIPKLPLSTKIPIVFPSISPNNIISSQAPSPIPTPSISPTVMEISSTMPHESSQAPSPIPTPSISPTVIKSSLEPLMGNIYDETTAPVSNFKVKVKSLNETFPYEQEKYFSDPPYYFDLVPSKVQIEITVSKPGYITIHRVVVLRTSSSTGGCIQGECNRFDFGYDGSTAREYTNDYMFPLRNSPQS